MLTGMHPPLTGNAVPGGPKQAYIFILGAIACAVSQVVWINKGLARFEAVKFVPTYSAALSLLGSAIGSVYFQEYAHPPSLPQPPQRTGIAYSGTILRKMAPRMQPSAALRECCWLMVGASMPWADDGLMMDWHHAGTDTSALVEKS